MSKISDLSDGGVIQGGDTLIAVRSGGNVKVTYGGSTTANIDGGTIDGTVIGGTTAAAGSFTTGSFTGNVSFGDNDKAIFGAGSDLQIYHDGNNSRIVDAGTGDLYLQANDQLRITNADATETMAIFNEDGAVSLRYNGSEKIATSSTGIDVTGTVSADGLAVDGDSQLNGDLTIFDGTGDPFIKLETPTQHYVIRIDESQSDIFQIRDSLNGANRLGIANNGDVSLYEDTGTTAKFFWDSSAESLGIGTSSPSSYDGNADNLVIGGDSAVGLTLASSATNGRGSIYFADGTSGDQKYRGTINYFHSSDDLTITTAATEAMRIDSAGNVGIGTSSPATNLEISDSSAAILRLTDSGSSAYSQIRADAGTLQLDANAGDAAVTEYISMRIAGSEAMRIDSSGNVGINRTAAAAAKLDVNLGASGDIAIFRGSSSDTFTIDSDGSGINLDTRNTTDGLTFQMQGANKMRIDSSGNVGIGTDSPSNALTVVDSTSYGQLRLSSSDADATIKYSALSFGQYAAAEEGYAGILGFSNSTENRIAIGGSTGLLNAATAIQFFTAASTTTTTGSEAMRINSGGTVLVGKTSSASSTVGAELRQNGLIIATTSSVPSLTLNRTTSDGTIAEFRKDNATVGSIGTHNGQMVIGSADTGLGFQGDSTGTVDDAILPVNISTGVRRDAAISLGHANGRFKDLYLSGGAYLGGSAAANKLDDYEEGTWTPIIDRETTSPSVTYASQTGRYTKIGRFVHATFLIQITGITTAGSGRTKIGGLPFSSVATEASGGSFYRLDGIDVTATGQFTSQLTGGTAFRIVALESDGDVTLIEAAPKSGYLIGQVVYEAS